MVQCFTVDGKDFGGLVIERKCQRDGLVTIEVIGQWPFGDPPKTQRLITLSRKFQVQRTEAVLASLRAESKEGEDESH